MYGRFAEFIRKYRKVVHGVLVALYLILEIVIYEIAEEPIPRALSIVPILPLALTLVLDRLCVRLGIVVYKYYGRRERVCYHLFFWASIVILVAGIIISGFVSERAGQFVLLGSVIGTVLCIVISSLCVTVEEE